MSEEFEVNHYCVLAKVQSQELAQAITELKESGKVSECKQVQVGKYNLLVRTLYNMSSHATRLVRKHAKVRYGEFKSVREDQLDKYLQSVLETQVQVYQQEDYQTLVGMYQRLQKLGPNFSFATAEESAVITVGPNEDSIRVSVELREQELYVRITVLKLFGTADISILDGCQVCLRIPNGDAEYTSILQGGQCEFAKIKPGFYRFTPHLTLRQHMVVHELRRAMQLLKKEGLSPIFVDEPIAVRDLKDSEYEIKEMILEELGADI